MKGVGDGKGLDQRRGHKRKEGHNAVFVLPIYLYRLFFAALPSVCVELYKKSCKYVKH
jgi:hypothetical protein